MSEPDYSLFDTARSAFINYGPPFTSVDQCRIFMKACRGMLASPKVTGTREGNAEFDLLQIEKSYAMAISWAQANDPAMTAQSSGAVYGADFSDFRR